MSVFAAGAVSTDSSQNTTLCEPDERARNSQPPTSLHGLRADEGFSALGRDAQNRIPAAKRIGDALLRVRVWQPLPIHYEQVFITPWIHRQITHPATIAEGNQRGLLRLPFIEGAGHADVLRSRPHQFQGHSIRSRWLRFRCVRLRNLGSRHLRFCQVVFQSFRTLDHSSSHSNETIGLDICSIKTIEPPDREQCLCRHRQPLSSPLLFAANCRTADKALLLRRDRRMASFLQDGKRNPRTVGRIRALLLGRFRSLPCRGGDVGMRLVLFEFIEAVTKTSQASRVAVSDLKSCHAGTLELVLRCMSCGIWNPPKMSGQASEDSVQ